MTAKINTPGKSRLSFKAQTVWTVCSLILAVAIPQILHVIGAVSGLGSSLGEVLLPMHLPIIFAGFAAGPAVGAVSGFFAPLISFALTGMPKSALLPFMMIELCVYGLSAGFLRNVKMPAVIKVLSVQVIGRAVRAAAILLAVYAFSFDGIHTAIIWKSIVTGLLGLCLQWIIIPLALYRTESLRKE